MSSSGVVRIPAVDPEDVRLYCRDYGRYIPAPKVPKRTVAKLGHRVHDNGCITLNGRLDRYACVRLNGATVRAHRAAYMMANNVEIGALVVHHRCGNPGCVNPEHLALATTHNHATAHARFDQRCKVADMTGTPRPRWIEVEPIDANF